ncbi:hypothetical protein Q9Q94_04545 [Uliginosibacterium sp. 31-16]|uniref:hypothetical protein n=1 Tax=Uliginosibacterium sp. 31-16 TaxID=3068315 RepID=UPI00273F23FD|nr:hypothetical protein [Uliginosibacterium sp. 31-16]MDP5238783.1 hypothetical protein [Uliginosibacterium sp. 31-16]
MSQNQPAMSVAPVAASSSLEQIVAQALLPQLDHFCTRLLAERKALVLDGIPVFNGRDKFLPGKIATGLSYLLLNTPASDPRFPAYLAGFGQIAELTLDEANDSWGIYYYVSALNRLREAGLLVRAVAPATLARLQHKLDWRSFVDAQDYSLINLPTNYYGVAFSIARLRHLLGWESAQGGEILLQKMVQHYQTYSGEFGFSDETDGEGRFDRYSILLIGEICQRFIETGLEVTPQLKAWLRGSVEVILLRLNPAGDGFDFGRSIGAYGDTAFLEVLAAAALLDVLMPQERELAYAFAVRATEKYAHFWFDAATHSVNLWDQGRRTDAYRGKHRILGENLSLLHQLIYTSRQWSALGRAGKPPMADADFIVGLQQLPRFTTTWFAQGEYDRALITFRDGLRVISLPVINGGSSLHAANPYFSIPFSSGLVQGAADARWPQLLPRFTLQDGSELIPAAFQRQLRCVQRGTALEVSWQQQALDRLGADAPVQDARLAVETCYTLDSGVITRTDRYTPREPLDGVSISLEFASFSTRATQQGHTVSFADGAAAQFSVSGLPECRVDDVSRDSLYRAPMGQMHTCVRCEAHVMTLDRPFTLSWTLRYR